MSPLNKPRGSFICIYEYTLTRTHNYTRTQSHALTAERQLIYRYIYSIKNTYKRVYMYEVKEEEEEQQYVAMNRNRKKIYLILKKENGCPDFDRIFVLFTLWLTFD